MKSQSCSQPNPEFATLQRLPHPEIAHHLEVEKAMVAINPAMSAPITEALANGVPWGTIINWIVIYGPGLAGKISELIKWFKGSLLSGNQSTPVTTF